MPSAAADIFRQAAELNRADPRRKGNVVVLQPGCQVLVCGDIHGNRTALSKIIAHADLAHHADRRLVLQELAHGPIDPKTGHDRSVEVLLRSARLQVSHPPQVLFVLGNHDVAQVTGSEITKDGHGVCQVFAEGVRFAFREEGDDVLRAVEDFLMSLPLALRCPNRVLITHSLPRPGQRAAESIPAQPYQTQDLRRGGDVYAWTWGRGHDAGHLQALADRLDVDFFVLGHKNIETGFEVLSDRAVVVVTDHGHGGLLQFSGDEPLTAELAAVSFKPTVALGGPGGPASPMGAAG